MKNRRVMELIRKEQRLGREICRLKERHDELVAAAMSTGSFRYDQERVTGPSPDGSRQERIVMEYVKVEEELRKKQEEWQQARTLISRLIRSLPVRYRRVMKARYLDQEEVESIMQRFGLSYETYRGYHSRAVRRMETIVTEQGIDSVHKI